MRTAHSFERRPIDDLYRWFASEASATSPTWQRLCWWIADQPQLCAKLDALPGVKRQPNVFLGALKYLDGPVEPGAPFLDWVDANWMQLEAVILARATQTNEPGRCAVLAPLLASLPQPITLLEVGSSAGLCLLPDRYRYRFRSTSDAAGAGPAPTPDAAAPTPDAAAHPEPRRLRPTEPPQAATLTERQGTQAHPDAPVLDCRVTGTPPGDPADLRIAARHGLDLNPLNPADPDDVRWLRALVWPGENEREQRLAACLALAAADPPPVASGDLRTDLDALLSRVAPGTTPVLQHSAVLAYLPRPDRDAFEQRMLASGVRWLSYEGAPVFAGVRAHLDDRDAWEATPNFVVALDGVPVARASAHGAWVSWY